MELLDGLLLLLNSLETLNLLSRALEQKNPTINPWYTIVSLAALNGTPMFQVHKVVGYKRMMERKVRRKLSLKKQKSCQIQFLVKL